MFQFHQKYSESLRRFESKQILLSRMGRDLRGELQEFDSQQFETLSKMGHIEWQKRKDEEFLGLAVQPNLQGNTS